MGNHRKLPLCPTDIPLSSKVDMPVAIAESISNGSSAFGMTGLGRGKKRQLQSEN